MFMDGPTVEVLRQRPGRRENTMNSGQVIVQLLKTEAKPVDLPDDVRRDMDAVVARADQALCP